MLTHCPDPPNLCDSGPGTAAEQASRPQMFADYVNGGWKPATRPMTSLTAVAVASEWTGSLGWQCYATEDSDWSNGAETNPGTDETSFNFPASGPYTITATAVDDAAVTSIPVLVRDQEVAPQLTSIAPSSYVMSEVVGDLEIILTGTGFTADARPRVIISSGGTYAIYEPSFEFVSPTAMRIWFDTSRGTGGQIFVWFPDGSTTYPRNFTGL